jgi:hypothetical protein
MKSEESVGMTDGNMGPSTTTVARTPRKVLSPIPETGASSPQRLRSLTPIRVEEVASLKRPWVFGTSKTFDSESLVEIQSGGPTGQSKGSWPSLEGI